ncbi:hypothetical protein ACFX2F_004110 [Malus domestica]
MQVKLNPSLSDAWLCLGNRIWKKGDLSSAKNCFNLALSKGPKRQILCQLSMLERKMVQGTINEAELVDKSIQHAKEAITLDTILESMSYKILCDWSLGPFQTSAIFEGIPKCNKCLKYLENYERALSGFEDAALKDPGLNATEEV